ncbi:MAG: DUF1642 domain-containing protein [Enterococcus casseliflavus]|nr:DUF1642 domain-containing protein [Enterococcus casseliflavus]
MEKQVLIEVLEKYRNGYQEQKDGYFKGAYDAYGVALGLVKKLDEQPKVTVPQFLAKFIQDNKGNSASDIFSQDWFHESADETDDEVNKWLYDNDTAENDRRYLIAVQAFVTGDYEVEKEQLYQVKIPTVNWDEYSSELVTEYAYLIWDITSDEYKLSASNKDYKSWRASLTESEIKSIDERYWAFAVQVEEPK